ncbi:MAG TPA: APC family permease [Candidatus Dormibacteraeota bacterium]|nr:APC family permease [Candidatus Dormibacteraeota bacterium]
MRSSGGPGGPPGDSRLDAGKVDDVTYLGQLGYRQELARALGIFGSFAIQFSLIGISIGLFLLFGFGLTTAGPWFIVPFIVGGFFQMFVGLSIAELISAYPLAGGAYQIINRITNRALAWQVGWWLAIGLLLAVSAEAVGIAIYIGPWIGIDNPTTQQSIAVAGVVIALVTVINIVGIKFASYINNIGVLAELFGLSTVVVLLLIHGLNQPVSFLADKGGTDANGLLVPFLTVLLMPVFIIGSFDSTGHVGEETKDAARTAPRGVLIANFGSFIYAIAAIVILLLAIPDLSAAMKSSAPITYIVTQNLGDGVANALIAVVVVSFIVNMQILELTAGRIFWAQARDGQAPMAGWLRKVGSSATPTNATIIAGLIAFAACLYSDALAVLAAASALGQIGSYAVTVAAGIVGKRRGTLPARPWNYGRWTSLIDWVAVIWAFFVSGVIVWQNPSQVGPGALAIVVIGLLIYYLGIPATRRGVMSTESPEPSEVRA